MANGYSLMRITKNIVPSDIKNIIKKMIFSCKYGFYPPPSYTELSRYEIILDFLKNYKIYKIEGDVVEIGVFLGGGTYKLSQFYKKYAPYKKIYAVDIFDPLFDETECAHGVKMKDLYNTKLSKFGGKTQFEVFRSVTDKCTNIEVLIGDSRDILLPCSNISFAYIDGNHSSEYVENDFYKIWEKLSSRGAIAFDDYGYDLPNVTRTIHEIIGKESKAISRIYPLGLKTIFIVKG